MRRDANVGLACLYVETNILLKGYIEAVILDTGFVECSPEILGNQFVICDGSALDEEPVVDHIWNLTKRLQNDLNSKCLSRFNCPC